MKKILLLGGSAQQVIAIQTARKLGYYTVLCDYLEDNPGQYAADRFYQVSTTDMDAVMRVAEDEKIDGLLAYASDPAAPTAAYVAEKLGLPGNPYSAVRTLCNKDLFRTFLRSHGFCTPLSCGYSDKQTALSDIHRGRFRFPVIIKPVDSSGSKGVTVLPTADCAEEAIDFAFAYSRSKRIIIEEYIERNHPYLIGGDVFVIDGKIVLWGLMNCHRDDRVNSLVPVGKSFPPLLGKDALDAVKNTLAQLISQLGIKNGEMNVEVILDSDNNVYLIDVGPRSGGNMIPDLIEMIFDTDVAELSVKTAMGEPVSVSTGDGTPYFATHNIHSLKDGWLKEIRFSDEIENHIVRKCLYKRSGDKVSFFSNAADALGIVFLKFDGMEEMLDTMDHSERWITVELEKEQN